MSSASHQALNSSKLIFSSSSTSSASRASRFFSYYHHHHHTSTTTIPTASKHRAKPHPPPPLTAHRSVTVHVITAYPACPPTSVGVTPRSSSSLSSSSTSIVPDRQTDTPWTSQPPGEPGRRHHSPVPPNTIDAQQAEQEGGLPPYLPSPLASYRLNMACRFTLVDVGMAEGDRPTTTSTSRHQPHRASDPGCLPA